MSSLIRPDFTFSKAALAEIPCRVPLLPTSTWTDETSDAARRGVALHALLAALVKGGIVALPEDKTDRARFTLARRWLLDERVGRRGAKFPVRAEVVFAWDTETRTGRELADPPGLEGTRWYASEALRLQHGIKPSEIPGRLDLHGAGLDEAGAFLQVDDYKFHFGPEMDEARAQLEICSRAASSALGFDRVKICGVHVWEDRIFLEEAELGAWELDTVALRYDELAHPPPGAPANDSPVSGAHCKAVRCPVRATCQASEELAVEALAPAPALLPSGALVRRRPAILEAELDNASAAKGLVEIDLLEELLKAAKTRIKAFADAHDGVKEDNGATYSAKTHEQTKPDLSVPGAVKVLTDLGLEFAIEMSTSWTAIKAIGEGAGEEKAREALAKISAVKTTPVTVYMSRKPAKPKAEKKATSRRAS